MNEADRTHALEEVPRLLIVEDDDRFAETLSAEFRDRGFDVIRVATLAEIRERGPDELGLRSGRPETAPR